MSILDKLPEHLKVVEQFKKDIPKVLLAALLYTESDIRYGIQYDNEEQRIDDYLKILKNASTHDGDCVNQCCTCILCVILESILYTEDEISVEVLLCTSVEDDYDQRVKVWQQRNEDEQKTIKERVDYLLEYVKQCLE